MNICMATVAHQAFDHRIFHKEAKSAVAAGHAVTLIAPADKDEVRDGVRILAVPRWFGPIGRVRAAIQVFWRGCRTKADIYHFHDPELMPFFWIVRAVKRKKVVADIHEYFPQVIQARTWIPPVLRRAAGAILRGLDAVNARLVDAVVVVTPSMVPLFPGAGRCIVVRNMASMEFGLNAYQMNLEREYDVAHLGSMTSSRARMIARVAEELERRKVPCEWLLLGISDEGATWLRRNTTPNIFERLHCVPHISHDHVPCYLKACKVGFNYHPYEARFLVSIPLKIFEYLCCGLPVVCTALPHVAEFMEEVDCGELVADNEPSSFADAIESLLKNPSLAREKARRGHEAILRQHCWEREAEKLMKLYDDLIGTG